MTLIPHNRPTLGIAEQEAARRVLASGWVAQGPEVAAFEEDFCEYLDLNSGHAVALSSGTAALFMALWVLDVGGKRVAIPVYSCSAVRNAVLMAGGHAVPVDVSPDSAHIDLDTAMNNGVDAVVMAHMFGMPASWVPAQVSVPVIEDCAQALGARIDGRPVGVRGTVGIFSFYATKMLTSGGQGGMLVSADKSLVDAVRDYREFDCRRDSKPRFNLQMTDLQASVGRAQLASLGSFLARRSEIYERYASAGLPLWPSRLNPGDESCYYRAIMRTVDPQNALSHLEKSGIRAIVPIADWELLDGDQYFPRAAALTRSTVSLPIYPSLSLDEVANIIRAASIFQQTEN